MMPIILITLFPFSLSLTFQHCTGTEGNGNIAADPCARLKYHFIDILTFS